MAYVNVGEGQSNIFEMVVPDNLCLYTKTTELPDAVIKKWEFFTVAVFENGSQRLQGRNLRWSYMQIFL